jgi:hypothetical protein
MTIEQTPAFARSDVRPTTVAAPSTPSRPFFRRGMMLTTGAVAWAVTQVFIGLDPGSPAQEAVFSTTSGMFQIGLLCLLTVLYRTQALGTGRLARFFLRLEAGLVTLAIGSTIVDGIGVSDLDKAGWLLLDMFWPISMLGMALIGIRIAIAGRWRGASRLWPMFAESWVLVTLPSMAIFGAGVGTAVSVVHLCLGYGLLGQIVARKEA